MNRYMMIRRLRGPGFLLLVGVLALMNQANILSWGRSWPLFLILAGVFALAERMALSAEDAGQYPGTPYPGAPYSGPTDPNNPSAATPQYSAQPETAIVPTRGHDFGSKIDGGQS
jgi:hypothetical protein